MLHTLYAWILFASSLPVNSCSLPLSSFSFLSLFTYKKIGWIQSAIVCCHHNFLSKLSTTVTNPYAMKYLKTSSQSKQVLERVDNSYAIFCQDKRGLHKCITPDSLPPPPTPTPIKECTGRRTLTSQAKFLAWMVYQIFLPIGFRWRGTN